MRSIATTENRAEVARTLGLDQFIKLSPRQQRSPPSKATLSLALSAIVGALWLDTSQDWGSMLEALGNFWYLGSCQIREMPASTDRVFVQS